VELISTLRRVTAQLERLAARDGRSLNQQVLDALADCGELSTSGIARLIRRRRADVLATINTMHAAGQLQRQTNGRWTLVE
jgi:DNA-binding MarR family transcriptional regulator